MDARPHASTEPAENARLAMLNSSSTRPRCTRNWPTACATSLPTNGDKPAAIFPTQTEPATEKESKMPKRDDVFPSKYLKCADLKGKPITVTIERAPIETLKGPDGREDTKNVLHFAGAKKTLPLNRTNWDSIAEITGEDDSDNWRDTRSSFTRQQPR
jgi:hypothetical protein